MGPTGTANVIEFRAAKIYDEGEGKSGLLQLRAASWKRVAIKSGVGVAGALTPIM